MSFLRDHDMGIWLVGVGIGLAVVLYWSYRLVVTILHYVGLGMAL